MTARTVHLDVEPLHPRDAAPRQTAKRRVVWRTTVFDTGCDDEPYVRSRAA